ncbi:hypothetical protein MTR_4g127980 [Medicago truncatula]|uniref:Uncharacterized protein n=1 Tax=Medicago truncatula TaxID=3880 RepID=G7JVE3_MEDTR|nr:hypothetical protein MTR_4g127980 [Medicago truncatula]
MSHVYNKQKDLRKEKEEKPLVMLWLANITMSPTTISPKCCPRLIALFKASSVKQTNKGEMESSCQTPLLPREKSKWISIDNE